MSITEKTKETLLNVLLSGLIGSIGYISVSIWKEASGPFAKHVVPAIGSTNLLWLCLLLLLMNLISGAWLLFLLFGDKSARILRKYEVVQGQGLWRHRDTGRRVCGNCLLEPVPIESPVVIVNLVHPTTGEIHRTVWECMRKDCGKTYPVSKEDADELMKPKPVS